MLPAKGLFHEILILWSMTESIIQPEPFPKISGMCHIIVVEIDSNTSSMSLLLIIVSAFECKWKMSYFILSSFSFFYKL